MDNNINYFKSVCNSPDNFEILYMPKFLKEDAFDNCSAHVHTFYEILWFKKGCGKHTVDFNVYDIKPDSILFLTPGQIHNFDNINQYEGISIKFCTDFMKDMNSASDLFINYDIFHSYDTTSFYTIDSDTAKELDKVVVMMEEEIKNKREFGHMAMLQTLLKLFFINIQRHGKHEGEIRLDELKPSHKIFVSFRKAVEQNFSTCHSVQDYADKLNVSVRTLNKYINECSSKSPLAFINERITLEAKRLVRYSDLMIKEIAYTLGFEDPSYFNKFFKRQTGYLPSDFREMDNPNCCRTFI